MERDTVVKLRILALAAYSKHDPRSPPHILSVRCAAACALACCGEGPGGQHTMTLPALDKHLQAVCPESWQQLKSEQPQTSPWDLLADGVLIPAASQQFLYPSGTHGLCSFLKLDVHQLELQAVEVAVRNASPDLPAYCLLAKSCAG
jgi:hypothetical protein